MKQGNDSFIKRMCDDINKDIVDAMTNYILSGMTPEQYFASKEINRKGMMYAKITDIMNNQITFEENKLLMSLNDLPVEHIIRMIRGIDMPPFQMFEILKDIKFGHYVGGFVDKWYWDVDVQIASRFGMGSLVRLYILMTNEKYYSQL